MATQPFSTRPDYVQSVLGLHRLHELTLAGLEETPESEVVRDGLDPLWWKLTDQERERINGLSEDLYSLSDPSQPLKPMNPQAQRGLVRALESKQAGHLDAALGLLRRWAAYIEPALLAYLRGSVWLEGGDAWVAASFFKHASNLSGTEGAVDTYQFMHLYALWKANPASARREIDAILNDAPTHRPGLVAFAANIHYVSLGNSPEGEDRDTFAHLAGILDRVLERLAERSGEECTDADRASYASAALVLGLCYTRLGETDLASRAFGLGLVANPHDEGFLILRGISSYGRNPAAIQDFTAATELGCRVVWPYYYLAHHALVSSRSEECLDLCERGLRQDASDAVRADLYEWMAISVHELGQPDERVRALFEKAVLLAPDNERIRKNLAILQGDTSFPPRLHAAWAKPLEAAIRNYGQANYRPILLNHPPELTAA